MGRKRTACRIDVERDAAGWWVATMRGNAGVHTQARTVPQLRERVHEAILAAEPRAAAARMVFTWNPPGLRKLVADARSARERAEQESLKAQRLLRRAARALEARGVGRRDAGELLGVSFQRVQQLVQD